MRFTNKKGHTRWQDFAVSTMARSVIRTTSKDDIRIRKAAVAFTSSLQPHCFAHCPTSTQKNAGEINDATPYGSGETSLQFQSSEQ